MTLQVALILPTHPAGPDLSQHLLTLTVMCALIALSAYVDRLSAALAVVRKGL